MQDRVSVETPDLATLEFELAGAGSRAMAYLLDLLITAAIGVALFALLIAAGLLAFSFDVEDAVGSWVMVVFVFAFFLLRWGYFAFFEAVMQGRTPGKKAAGIRVVQDSGLPIGPREALLRNLVRFVDELPAASASLVGLFSVLINRHGKRLGDMAAGTIVIRERFAHTGAKSARDDWSAQWAARLERGESRHAVHLPTGKVSVKQLALMDRYLERASEMDPQKREELAWRIAAPYLSAFELDPERLARDPGRVERCEDVIAQIIAMAKSRQKPGDAEEQAAVFGREKLQAWLDFDRQAAQALRRGKRALAKWPSAKIGALLADYRRIIADLGRARAMDADHHTLDRLNRMAVAGHNVLYGHIKRPGLTLGGNWLARLTRLVRGNAWAAGLSAVLFFAPAIISYLAIQIHPDLAYDMVGDGWIYFEPADKDNMHDIPELSRPVVASSIIANNVQVSLLAFGLGLTFGLGTCWLLIFNGVHLGAVAGWMAHQGSGRSLWGWVMPHGGTEILAIILAGAAGLILARALVAPGTRRRITALKAAAFPALTIELGVMGMLLIAGLIEGFVSPSGIGYSARIAIFAVSVAFWLAFFGLYGLGAKRPHATLSGSARNP